MVLLTNTPLDKTAVDPFVTFCYKTLVMASLLETSFTPDNQKSDYWLTVRQVDLPRISNFIKSGHHIQFLSNVKHIGQRTKAGIPSLSSVLAMPVIFSKPFDLHLPISLLTLPTSQY